MASETTAGEHARGTPVGLRDGRLYLACEVARGRRCGCVCPACGAALQAKRGSMRQAHFAHDSSQPGASCRETALHFYAKQTLAEARTLMLPSWQGTSEMPNPPQAPDGEGRIVVGEVVDLPARDAMLSNGRTEVSFGPVRVDACVDDDEGPLLVEVRVSHAVDDLKRARVEALGMRMLELDLSRAIPPGSLADAAAFSAWLAFMAPRRWVTHPDAAGSWRRSKRAVDAIVASREPVFGPGRNCLVRVGAGLADRARHLAAKAGLCDCGGPMHALLGAWVWLDGPGAAEIVDIVDCKTSTCRARTLAGVCRLTLLGAGWDAAEVEDKSGRGRQVPDPLASAPAADSEMPQL